MTRTARRHRLALLLCLLAVVAGCTSTPSPGGSGGPPATGGGASAPAGLPAGPPAAVCDNTEPGPATAPPGAVVIDPAVPGDLVAKTDASPPGTTFWLGPGVHTLGTHQFDQVSPKDGDVYTGAPGAIVDGKGVNYYAFAKTAKNVTISHLTVRGFTPPQDQGVVNHDSGNGWTIVANTIEDNGGAGLMAGAHQQVRGNCLRNNGQYGLNAYQPGNGITGLVVEGNEIVGNNTGDWETKVPGCGCSGGMKFWSVDGADVRGNWIHANHGPGIWADTNDNDFLIEGNLIENNDAEAVFYETSYNLVMRDNLVRGNAMVAGKAKAAQQDAFPVGAVYLSESGGEPRIKARTAEIDISGNRFENNWGGIVAWENADRFCNSPANTSTGVCTLLVPDVATCVQPGIATPPLYDDCRWKTQNVDVHDNTFVADPAVVGCDPRYASRSAVLSNYGTYPDWSPYHGEVIQKAISTAQHNTWANNTYQGNWSFVFGAVEVAVSAADWQNTQKQDVGSTFTADDAARC
ncbi:right-handed parallel beta-helix repeat-containing protein [Pseudonocardia benzenivorans]|uniref:Lipoprotein n=2 Tax=Pseudonocardia TaxID=1847 RepID=F4CR28_PSEUX|nr:right-handed parallel beta-helix repeat-containing protein [Pseudonocardia dioxanivorans]AEA24086.1 lipoprotein [Pseudonocardia dioxanivorans CB1190]GJF07478.1 lipoprotein [Pseudonocardia sp. D17]